MAPTRGRNSKKDITGFLENVPASLSADSKLLIALLREEFSKLNGEIVDSRNHFTQILSEKQEEVESLKCEVDTLKSKILKLEQAVDDADAYERRDTVIVSGPGIPVFERGENSSELVREAIQSNLQLNVSPTDISTAHRIGGKPANQSPDKRSFIVKFCRRDLKRDVIFASKNQRRVQQNQKIFVNDNLTPLRRSIFKTLRHIRREHPTIIKGVGVYEGKIFAYTNSEGTNPDRKDKRHLINSKECLSNFCINFIKKSLDEYLEHFRN